MNVSARSFSAGYLADGPSANPAGLFQPAPA